MPVTRIACPNCSAGLTFGTTPAPGTRVKCPRCATLISLGAASPAPAAIRSTVRPAAMAPAAVPRSTPLIPAAAARPARSVSGSMFLCLALGLGLLLLLGGSLAVIAVVYVVRKQPAQVVDARPSDRKAPAPAPQQKEEPPAPKTPSPDKPPPSPPLARNDPVRPPPFGDFGNLNNPPPALALNPLPPAEQQKVDAAIDRGVKYLKSTQLPAGTWGAGHPLGYAALPGLTLLECGVPASDPAVQKVADFVRKAVVNYQGGHETYQLSLAILFLDRLGDSRDRPILQQMALRLIAGQNGDGGWGYRVPQLSKQESEQLLTALQVTRPQTALELFVPDGSRPLTPTDRPGIGEEFLPIIIQQQPGNLPGTTGTPPRPVNPGGNTTDLKPVNPPPPPVKPAPRPDPKKPGKGKPPVVNNLPPALQDLPALQNKLALTTARGRSDNSNTQFAALALWAARRHDVPMERTLAFLEKRFRTSQNADGSWGYSSGPNHKDATRPNTMTCAGLLGLALGHGVLQELQARSAAAGQPVPVVGAVQDQGILKGIEYVSTHVGTPSENGKAAAQQNLYFMWSLERVGVLFNLKTIKDKEWYRWGAQMLVGSQQGNGSWTRGGYPGAAVTMDTCFALLFLKRANLAKDLTDKLEFLVEVKSP